MKPYFTHFILSAGLAAGCSNELPYSSVPWDNPARAAPTASEPVEAPRGSGATSYEQKLREAREITITERAISLGKDYEILVGKQKVATVAGKDVRFFGGDVFELRTLDGKLLASEQEHQRWGRLNRAATVQDGQGKVTGYIGEETLNDFLSIGYIFHFYDPNKQEVGRSRKIGRGVIGWHTLKDVAGNDDYEVDKALTMKSLAGADSYVVKVRDPKSEIPLEQAIILVCIEDAIKDSQEEKEEAQHRQRRHRED